jgi:8-oxo-dGTP pyrophosphatase MutT (NUDIX family)
MTDRIPDDLDERLAGPLPGLAAQLRMMPDPPPQDRRTYAEVGDDCLRAGVMILVYPREDRPHLVFIRRPETAVHHKGQIAFPGGAVEDGEDCVRAALRETREEVGVPAEAVLVRGTLTPLFVSPSGYCIHPVVGTAARRPDFVPFPEEVAEILEVPLAVLLDPAAERRETWEFPGGPRRVPFFAFGRHKIWGATAMVLAEFLDVVRPGRR